MIWRIQRFWWLRSMELQFNEQRTGRMAAYGEPSVWYALWKVERVRRATSETEFYSALKLTVFDFYEADPQYVERIIERYPLWAYQPNSD